MIQLSNHLGLESPACFGGLYYMPLELCAYD